MVTFSVAELHAGSVEKYDVFLSFTRTSPGAEEQTERISQALSNRGLRVFRDSRIDEFDGITAKLVAALAGSKVLLVYYTREYPRRYACQWELTAAFVAAQREGDPRRRVLVVNPEPGEPEHLRPVELSDAKYAGEPRTEQDFDRLSDRVVAQVAAVRGPLGAPQHPVDRMRLPPEVLAPQLFVGRYPEMWDVHTALHAMDLAGVHQPAPEPAVLISGLSGAGKTSLAARYAYLYRDAYPGGVFWTGPFGDDPHTVLGRFTDQLRRLAPVRLGLPVDGVEPDRLRAMVADALSRAKQKVLWVVDDVPPGLPADVLTQLLVPAYNVRTIVTSRATAPDWDVRSLELGGLTRDDAFALFDVSAPDEKKAVRDFVDRCGGHPMVVRSVVNDLRYRSGPLTEATVAHLLANAAKTVGDAVERDVAELDALARQVLRVAAVLAAAPFPSVLAQAVLADGSTVSETMLAAAVEQLVRRGLLQLIGTDWTVHPLVSDVMGAEPELAARTAAALVPLLTAGGPHLAAHAVRLGDQDTVPLGIRQRLLRLVVADHEMRGDPLAALEVQAKLMVVTDPDTLPVADLLTAARVYLAAGRYSEAERFAGQALECADVADDFRTRHRARLLRAQALDQLGDHDAADRAYWVELADRFPAWLAVEDRATERMRAGLALASAKFLRGTPKEALAIVESIVTELRAAPPGPLRDDLTPTATLELARLLQLTGKARTARELAAEVIAQYRERGMGAHAGLLEAEGIWADAFLTLDLTELDGKPENWQRAERKLRELASTYAEKWGAGSAVALAARVRADRALLSLGKPRQALRALSEVEPIVIDQLGRHRLVFRVRHAMAQAYGQLREFERQRDILQTVLPDQTELLGRFHPETLESQLDLGIALAMTGDSAPAVDLVDEAARALRHGLGARVDLSGKATTAQWVVRLPYFLLRTVGIIDRIFGPEKKTD